MRACGIGATLFLILSSPVPAAAAPTAADEEARIALIARVGRSVVHVRNEQTDPATRTPAGGSAKKGDTLQDFFDSLDANRPPRRQEGSGFVVDGQRGLIVTAAHIVQQAKTLRVALPDGSEKPAELVGTDEDSGVALLRVDGLALPSIALSSRPVRAGETAWVVGWMIPLKSVMPIEGMVMGPVPAIGEQAAAPPFADYVAMSGVLPNGGFGGSPVVDRDGAVIGVVSAIYGRTYGADALTLMLNAAGVAPVVAQLAASGTVVRSEIGITLDCSEDACKVRNLDEGGPAAAAGIRAGDALLAIDGVQARTESALRRAIAAKPVGSTIAVTIWRDGRQSVVRTSTQARSPGSD